MCEVVQRERARMFTPNLHLRILPPSGSDSSSQTVMHAWFPH